MNYSSMENGRSGRVDPEEVKLVLLRLKTQKDQLDAKEEDEDVGMSDFSAIERKLIRQLVAQAKTM